MGAATHDAAVFQHEDLVGAPDGGDALGDDQGGAVRRRRGQGGPQAGVGGDVEGGEGIVEDVDGGFLHQRPRDGQALPLPARDVRAALRDVGGETAVEFLDEIGGLGDPQRLPHLLRCGVGAPVEQVGGHRPGEQVGFLRHQPDPRPQGIGVEVTHVDAVHQHLAAADVVQAGDQVHQGGLARSRRPDDRGGAARGQGERQVRQHRILRTRVGEGDVAELDDARQLLRGDRVGGGSHRGFGVEHLQDAVRRHRGARRQEQQHRRHHHRDEDLDQVIQEGGHLADLNVAGVDAEGAEPDHRHR